ncbi:MAG TPA: hypothetical protein VF077_03145 [Nitrospiraceae bacterium]
MIRAIVVGFFLMFMAAPLWAAEAEPFNPEAPFQQGLSTGLLRSLLNQALDQLEDHIEIMGKLDPDDVKGNRQGRLQFKFYPEGKSKSDEHVGAESWFRVAPDHTLRDFYFRFKHPEDSLKHSSPQSGEVL